VLRRGGVGRGGWSILSCSVCESTRDLFSGSEESCEIEAIDVRALVLRSHISHRMHVQD